VWYNISKFHIASANAHDVESGLVLLHQFDIVVWQLHFITQADLHGTMQNIVLQHASCMAHWMLAILTPLSFGTKKQQDYIFTEQGLLPLLAPARLCCCRIAPDGAEVIRWQLKFVKWLDANIVGIRQLAIHFRPREPPRCNRSTNPHLMGTCVNACWWTAMGNSMLISMAFLTHKRELNRNSYDHNIAGEQTAPLSSLNMVGFPCCFCPFAIECSADLSKHVCVCMYVDRDLCSESGIG